MAFVHSFHIDIDFLCEYLSNSRQHNVFGVSVFSVVESSEGKWWPRSLSNIWAAVRLASVLLSLPLSRRCFNIKEYIWQKTSNEMQCNDFWNHSASVSTSATVKIKFLWTTAGSKMFYVLWHIYIYIHIYVSFRIYQKWTDWNSLRFWKLKLQKSSISRTKTSPSCKNHWKAYLIQLQYNIFTFSQL